MFFAPAGSFWTGKLMPNCFLPLNPANSSSFFTRQNVVIAIWNSFHRFGVINAFTNAAQKLGPLQRIEMERFAGTLLEAPVQ